MKKIVLALTLVSFLGSVALFAGNDKDKDKEKKASCCSEKKSCCAKANKEKASCDKKSEEKPQ